MNLRTILVATLALATPATACWGPDYSTWESRVADADQIGVFECVAAGYNVGRYRVVESWHPDTKLGHELTLGLGGMHLVGDRLLLLTKRLRPGRYPNRGVHFRSSISTCGELNPLGGRAFEVDHSPRFDVLRLPRDPAAAPNLQRLKSPHASLDAFKAAVLALQAADPAERELRVLRSLAERLLEAPSSPDRWSRVRAPLLQRIRAAGSVEQAVGEVLAVGEAHADFTKPALILSLGGRELSLDLLERSGHPAGAAIRRRLQPEPLPKRRKPPTQEERLADQWRRLNQIATELRGDESTWPAPTGPFDLGELIRDVGAWIGDGDYWLASEVCLNVPVDRARSLRPLFEARSRWVRVASAVYATLAQDPDAPAVLTQLSRLDGGPGAWAALTLARRGDRSAVPRLLEVFRAAPDGESGERARLLERAQVLLSNAAARAGVAQPPRFEEPSAEVYTAVRDWWSRHEPRLELHDPWAAELQAQHVD